MQSKMGVESIRPVRGLQQWTPSPSTVSIPRCGSLPVAGMAAAGSEAALEAGWEAEAVEMGAWEGARAAAREAEPVEPVGPERTCRVQTEHHLVLRRQAHAWPTGLHLARQLCHCCNWRLT